MSFDPYIHFQGNCRQAMEAYRDLFGGTLSLMTYAEAPDATAGMQGSDRVMHATLAAGGRSIMASDFPPGHEGQPQASVTISHEAASDAEARRLFTALKEGGSVMMDYQPTFWSDGFGMLTDRFGTSWMISAPWRRPG